MPDAAEARQLRAERAVSHPSVQTQAHGPSDAARPPVRSEGSETESEQTTVHTKAYAILAPFL